MKVIKIGLDFSPKKPSFIITPMLSHPWGACMFAPAAPNPPKYITIVDHERQVVIGFAVYCQKNMNTVEITGIHIFIENTPNEIPLWTIFGISAHAIANHFNEKNMKVEVDIISSYEEDMWEIAIKNGAKVEIKSTNTIFTMLHHDFLTTFSLPTEQVEKNQNTVSSTPSPPSNSPSSEVPENR